MRKTLVLLAVAALLALSAAVYGSPPTKREKTFSKTNIVKTDTANPVNAVVTVEPEARTVESANVVTLNSNELAVQTARTAVKSDYAATVNRHSLSPPERLNSGNAESRATSGDTQYERPDTSAPAGYVLRL